MTTLACLLTLLGSAAAPAGATEEAAATWQHVPPRDYPEARGIGAMVWDAARGEAVLFGGAGYNWFHNDTWVWDGAQWAKREPATSPPARRYFDMVYDPVREEVVLFGGEGPNNSRLGDTWVWDGTDWTERAPSAAPSGRSRHAMAWDPARQGVLLFGGIAPAPSLTGFSAVADTWLWDGADWTELQAPVTPGPRFDHAMVWDEARDEVLLFGGTSAYAGNAGPTVQGTWVWDGVTWVLRQPDWCTGVVQSSQVDPPPCIAPQARERFDMAFDAVRGEVVVFGGGGGFRKGDTWVWDGLGWTERHPARSPLPRTGGVMAFDPVRERTVLFGGQGNSGYLDDTWVWDGQGWASPARSPLPAHRSAAATVYDPVREEVVIFGGRINITPSLLDDTWIWDGVRWTQRHPDVSPPPRENAAIGFHAATQTAVLFGGWGHRSHADDEVIVQRDTWLWDGTTWTEVFPETVPPQRTSARMALHESTGRLVMFGGWAGSVRLDDMWEWTGEDWVQLIPYTGSNSGLSPSPRNGHAMAYDPTRDLVIVHDGIGAPPDTWGWDGSAWTRLVPAQAPPDRDQATLGYDGGTGMVLFGGLEGVAPRNNTFAWDGSTWRELFDQPKPERRREHRMVWDAARGHAVMFGGDWALHKYNDTWLWATELPADENRRPVPEISIVDVSGPPDARTVTLALSATDPDPKGRIVSWSLDVTYDGIADYEGEGEPPAQLSHTFAGNETWNIVLTATDDFGDSRAAVVTVPAS